MNECDLVLDRLDDLLDGRLSASDRAAVEAHLGDCPRCRELAALVGGELGRIPDETPAGLAEAILSRTSGSTCASARERLCAYVDEEIDPVDRELVRLHLERCAPCAALAGALARLARDLPALAEAEPQDDFVAGVLARTSGRRRPVERWAARLAAGWAELIRRPRFAWEAAYVATFALALIFATPASPLAGVQRSALELAEANPVAGLRQPVARVEDGLAAGPPRVWRAACSRAAGAFDDAKGGAGRFARGLGDKIRAGFGTLTERLASMQETEETRDNDRSGAGRDRDQGEGR